MVKLWGFLILLLASIGIFFALVYTSILNATLQPIPPIALQGKEVFQAQACIECHTVFGNGGYVGGDLTKIYNQTSAETLKAYLTNPPLLTGAKKKRHVQVTEHDAILLVEYLKYLNTINTLDWPRTSKTYQRSNVP
jgi:nitric oxide reductase subunit C